MRTRHTSWSGVMTFGLMPFVVVSLSAENHLGVAVKDIAGGASALSVSTRLLGRPLDAEHLSIIQEQGSEDTLSLQGLAETANKLGFATRSFRLQPKTSVLEKLPLIVKYEPRTHATDKPRFVVLYGMISGNRVQVIDYPLPPQFVSIQTLAESWDGNGLYVAASEEMLPASDQWSDAGSATGILALPLFALGVSIASALFWWVRERRQSKVLSP